MSVSDDVGSIRSLSQISEEETVKLSVDLVAAARHNLGFLRLVDDSDWLHQKPSILESIRRYDQLWMPLISDLTVGSTPPMVLPPLDVEWIWFCHTLNAVSYREYCKSRFSKLIGKAAIFDEENEEYALNRCKEIWEYRYPSEPFESEFELNLEKPCVINEDLLDQVSKQRYLYTIFNEPYRSEVVYLIAARQSYKGFLYSLNRISERCSLLVPPSDVLLMWLTHQSYPTVYAQDTKELEGHIEKVHGAWDDVNVKEGAIEEAKNMWEEIFDRPYEKAGGSAIGRAVHVKPPFYWDASDTDVNTKYRSLAPRFLLEEAQWGVLEVVKVTLLLQYPAVQFCISVKLSRETRAMKRQMSNEFLRLRMARCHKELKLDKPLLDFRSESWRKAWHLYCEFGTKGVILELRQRGGRCFKGSNLQCSITFLWNDLLRARSLTWSKEIVQVVKADASITPPVQAPYLLKCVPDRVTDDSGAMISDVILRMNEYRPQAGRWLSRTVLDHAGRECFVIRMRMGGGFWRRGGETPSAVKWEDRIIEIREGSWSYVASSIGKAPEKVVGTATPQEPPEEWQASWNISTGNELLIRWASPTSSSGLNFVIRNKEPTDRMVRLLKGRKMQYQVKKSSSASDSSICKKPNDTDDEEVEEEEEEEEEDGFITLVRFSEELPTGKATALLNWKLLAVEVLPEEDAVFVLLICLSLSRSISEMKKEDVGSLLIRRRIKEPKPGERDWGSIMLHPSSYSPSISSPYLQPWYWNAKAVMASKAMDDMTRPPAMNLNYSPAEGGDKLYKRGVFALKKL